MPYTASTSDSGQTGASSERNGVRVPLPLAEHEHRDTQDLLSISATAQALELKRARASLASWVEVVWITDANGHAVAPCAESEAWRTFTGQTVAEMVGWGWLEMVAIEDRERVRAAWEQAHHTASPFRVEFNLRRGMGEYRVIAARVTPLLGDGGMPREWVASGMDITDFAQERKLVQAITFDASKMATRARELETIFDAMTNGVVVYEANGQLSYLNARAREVLGISADASFAVLPLAERAEQLVMRDEHGHVLAPEEWPQARLLRGEVLRGVNAVEAQIKRLDGGDIWINFTGSPIYAGEAVAGAVAVFDDVTTLRQLERRTHEALGALIAMAESLVGAESTQSANPSAHRLVELTCQVMGCDRASIHAIDPASERIHPVAVVGLNEEQERHWWATWQHGPRASDILNGDLLNRLSAGEVVIADLSQSPASDKSNPYEIVTLLMAPMRLHEHLTGVLALDYGHSKHDYTKPEIQLAQAVAHMAALVIERDRLLRDREASRAREMALKEANRRMDEFLSMASHELRNPLTSIKANLQLAERRIRRQRETPEAQADVLTGIYELLGRSERQADFLDRLVGDLLDVSRISAGKLDIRPAPTDLSTVVRDAVLAQRLANPARAITLARPEGAVPVEADADRVGQVVTNYLTNALKYSPADRPVAVELDVEGRRARVSVRDQGPGLPPEERELIWERFHRVPGIVAQSGSGGGLGLGLHISRTLVERQGGAVGVESTPGQGSTFWFTLPIRRTRKRGHTRP